MTIEQIQQWCMYVGAVILVCTPAILALQKASRAWLESSKRTETLLDDRVANAFVWALDGLAYAITMLPRVTLSLGEVRKLRDAVRRISPPVTTLAIVLALSTSTACGATQMDRARTILSVSGQGVVAAEQVFEGHYAAAGERARAESDTYAEYVERMHNWNVAATSIRLTAASLHLAESQLDAIEQGIAGDVGGVLACVGTGLVELLDVLASVIDVPDELVVAIRLVSAIAGDRCDPVVRPTEPPAEAHALIGGLL